MTIRFLLPSFLLVAVMTTASAAPVLIPKDVGIERANVQLSVDSRGEGTARVAACADCEEITLAVTAATLVIVDGVVTTPDATVLEGKFVSVFYDPETETVTKITGITPGQ